MGDPQPQGAGEPVLTSTRHRTGPSSRAGRNLPAAIGVGVGLGALVLLSLFLRKEAFLAVAGVSVALGVAELALVLRRRRFDVPLVPMVAGTAAMFLAAYLAGLHGLFVAFVLTCAVVLAWRLVSGGPELARDGAAGVFVAAYVPLLGSFTALMLAQPDGAVRIVVFILVTVASDIGGYAAGVLFGRHPMAPTVSPKKSWEGAAGSALTCMVVGALAVGLLLSGPWWAGLLVGAAAVVSATVGDLSESLLKRDLGVKDMGNLLPGHGGMMDRLDSLLLTAPVVAVLLGWLVPAI